MILERSFLEPLSIWLLEIILFLVIGVPKLEFLYLYFILLSKTLFRLFLNFLESFYITGRITCRLGLLYFFRLFDPKILYSNVFNLYLGYSKVNKIIALLDLVIHFLNIRSRLKVCFGFNFHHFFNHLFSGI